MTKLLKNVLFKTTALEIASKIQRSRGSLLRVPKKSGQALAMTFTRNDIRTRMSAPKKICESVAKKLHDEILPSSE